jgi:CRP/FNR family transcriptional regulator, cyclic AMP receptor protein
MKSLWFFENVNLFKFLCPHKYGGFEDEHTFLDFNKGDFIYLEEDKSDKIYLINSGKIKIGYINDEGEEMVLAILNKGEIFGEKAIFDEDNRNEFAQVIEANTSICSVTNDQMMELLKNNNDFNLSIYRFIGYRFKKLERRIQLLLFKDAKTRLKEFLKELGDEYGYTNVITNDIVIKHPYTQKEIATLIGTSRPTINLLLNELKSEKYLDFDRKEIILKK